MTSTRVRSSSCPSTYVFDIGSTILSSSAFTAGSLRSLLAWRHPVFEELDQALDGRAGVESDRLASSPMSRARFHPHNRS